jgi:hypothetical protein
VAIAGVTTGWDSATAMITDCEAKSVGFAAAPAGNAARSTAVAVAAVDCGSEGTSILAPQ